MGRLTKNHDYTYSNFITAFNKFLSNQGFTSKMDTDEEFIFSEEDYRDVKRVSANSFYLQVKRPSSAFVSKYYGINYRKQFSDQLFNKNVQMDQNHSVHYFG